MIKRIPASSDLPNILYIDGHKCGVSINTLDPLCQVRYIYTYLILSYDEFFVYTICACVDNCAK